MKRVIYMKDRCGNEVKYILRKEYRDFGIYAHMCPNGLFVNQDYLVANDNIKIVSQSYNHKCMDELYDMIDGIIDANTIIYKSLCKDYNLYVLHSAGIIRTI